MVRQERGRRPFRSLHSFPRNPRSYYLSSVTGPRPSEQRHKTLLSSGGFGVYPLGFSLGLVNVVLNLSVLRVRLRCNGLGSFSLDFIGSTFPINWIFGSNIPVPHVVSPVSSVFIEVLTVDGTKWGQGRQGLLLLNLV